MGNLVSIQITPTITAGTYATGNALGGLQTLTSMGSFGAATLRAVIVTDKANQKSAMDIVFFGKSFTATTDKSAIGISTADNLNAMGSVNVATTDWITLGTPALATKQQSVLLPMIVLGGDNNIYAQIVCRGTPTYASVSDISVRYIFELMDARTTV